jgi:hypothetical protein
MKKTTASQKYTWLPEPPVDVNLPYALGNYEFSDVSAAIAKKYLNRSANLKRAWARICTHLPETTSTNEKLDILEFSTAHGAMLEIWQALGHNATGTDYCVPKKFKKKYRPVGQDHPIFRNEHTNPLSDRNEDWVYQPIIESLGANVCLFDAGQTPYHFGDNSFDYVCCYQAIEAYAVPGNWDRIVKEFCRITRRAVVIGFNPPPMRTPDGHGWSETEKAWELLRTFDAYGFKNVFFEFEETNRGLHPSACKLVRNSL